MKKIYFALFIFLVFTSVNIPVQAATDLPDTETLGAWVRDMKSSPRGPFSRIRWFCADGSILPPKPYACREHGGRGARKGGTARVGLPRQIRRPPTAAPRRRHAGATRGAGLNRCSE